MGENVEYVCEGGVNYLRIRQEGAPDYRLEMLLQNNPKGLLPVEFRQINEELWLYCRVSGVQSLSQRLERERMGEAALRHFFGAVEQVCRSMEEYLLPFEELALEPDYIYVQNGSQNEYRWVYGKKSAAGESEKLLEYLLDHIDFDDQEGVRLMYFLYQEYRERGGEIETIRECWRLAQSSLEEAAMADLREEAKNRGAQRSTPAGEGRHASLHRHGDEQRKQAVVREKKGLLTAVGKRLLAVAAKIAPVGAGIGVIWKQTGGWKQTALRQQEPCPEASAPTMLLTGGMTGGGIYCLRAVSAEGKDLLLTEYPFFVGKEEKKGDCRITDDFVSRFHARLDREGEEILLMDLNSTNGTFLNRERLVPYEPRRLTEGDRIIFAHREYEFCFLY